ncbi:hypothetical protein AG1IA_06660 [Rhizoctonia solani AG-1 IA]|uniref:Uncharacterized protein n=1 Tax=Thanatephorus cucumeris (strain AG1-IA) TaxID=983506 RepID=L8WRF2_THACA|nr:hypothetical protein AG1IA_06660 [Rhizoctonia solani AG-1 IA]
MYCWSYTVLFGHKPPVILFPFSVDKYRRRLWSFHGIFLSLNRNEAGNCPEQIPLYFQYIPRSYLANEIGPPHESDRNARITPFENYPNI